MLVESGNLARVHNHYAACSNRMFSTVKNWGEVSTGDWSLRIRDGFPAGVSLWSNSTINDYETAVPEPTAGFFWLACC
jgi:subtilisin-like proprotein convertase family protein